MTRLTLYILGKNSTELCSAAMSLFNTTGRFNHSFLFHFEFLVHHG